MKMKSTRLSVGRLDNQSSVYQIEVSENVTQERVESSQMQAGSFGIWFHWMIEVVLSDMVKCMLPSQSK